MRVSACPGQEAGLCWRHLPSVSQVVAAPDGIQMRE